MDLAGGSGGLEMHQGRRPWVWLAAIMTLLSAAPAVAANFNLKPTDSYGLIAFHALPPDLRGEQTYSLAISVYAPDQNLMKANPFSGYVIPRDLGKNQVKETLYLAKAKPGIYGLMGLSIRETWGVCYNAKTVSFEVKPGAVTYIGRLDPNPALDAIFGAVASGLLPQATSSRPYLFDDYAPDLTPPDQVQSWEADLNSFLAAQQPGVTAPAVAADLRPAHFATGRDAFGVTRICGGYYAKPSKAAETRE